MLFSYAFIIYLLQLFLIFIQYDGKVSQQSEEDKSLLAKATRTTSEVSYDEEEQLLLQAAEQIDDEQLPNKEVSGCGL